MGLLIILLSGHLLLDLAEVEELSGLLVLGGQGALQVLAVLLEVLRVLLFHGQNLVLVVLLGLLKLIVPVLVEVLVLFDVRLLALLTLLLMHEDEFLLGAVKLLFLELGNPVLGHFSLHVATLAFARGTVLLHRRNEFLDVIRINLVILTAVDVLLSLRHSSYSTKI